MTPPAPPLLDTVPVPRHTNGALVCTFKVYVCKETENLWSSYGLEPEAHKSRCVYLSSIFLNVLDFLSIKQAEYR